MTEPQSAQEASHYDVIVVGGGAAGVGAAVGAKLTRPESRVLLLESGACLGGAATIRGVVSYCGLFTCETVPKKVVGGVWDLLRPLLLEYGATTELPTRHRGVFQVIDPEGLKICLDKLVNSMNIDVRLHSSAISAEKTDSPKAITSVRVLCYGTETTYHGAAFVDCSGDCALTYASGASLRYGNHGTVNLGSLSTTFGGFAPNVKPTAKLWEEAIRAAKKQDPSLNSKIRKNTSVLLHLPGPSGHIATYLASAACDLNDPSSITKAEQSAREQAWIYLSILKKLPGHENMYIVSTGPDFGIRESRHANCKRQLKKEDLLQGTNFKDVVAIGGWGMEWHEEQSDDWASSFTPAKDSLFEIPLSCLQSCDMTNLFVAGRCADGDQYAGSAHRVMGTALATGQAAGVAAALTAEKNGGEGWKLDVKHVQDVLRGQGAILSFENLESVDVQ